MEQLSILPLHYVVCEIRYVKSGKKNFDYVGVQFLPTPFKSHTVLKWHRIVDTVEDPRAFCFFKFSFENKFVLFVLN